MIGEMTVQRRDAGPGIDKQQGDVSFGNRHVRLPAHARLHGIAALVLETSGIDHLEFHAQQAGAAFPAVAGHAGKVVDDGQALAHQTVEQGGLPHIGAPDDGHGKRHE
jgi:hypothetical protein